MILLKALEKVICIVGGLACGLGIILASGEYLNWLELMFALFVSFAIISIAFVDWSNIDSNTKKDGDK